MTARRLFSLRRAVAVAAVLASAAGSLALPACTSPGSGLRYPPGGLTIASGGSQGVYYQYAKAYQKVLAEELPKLKVKIVVTGGAIDNLERIAHEEAQLGFATADTAYQTEDADPAFDAPRDLRAIARIYDEYIHLVVRADSPARSLRDLRGLRVSTGQQGSSTELVADRLLGAVGLRADADLRRSRIGINDSVAKLRSGEIDAFFWSGGLPTPGIRTLAEAIRIRLLPLGDQVNQLRAEYGTFYRRATVPTTTYQNVPQAVTIGVPDYLVVAGDLDADLVHALTRVLFERRRDIAKGQALDGRAAISTSPIALHPGAERYYRQVKP